MAILNFVSGQVISLKDDGSVNAGGKIYFYVIGTTTAKDTYPTAADAEAMTNPNANPLIMNSAGRGTAFLNGDYKVVEKDSNDVTLRTTDRVNPTATVTSTARSTAYTLIGTDTGGVTEASGTFTLTLTAAATLTSGWNHYVKNVGTGTITIARANSGDTINGTAANITLAADQGVTLRVIDAETGFITDNSPATRNTFTPVQYFTAGLGPSFVNNYSLSGAVAASALTITISGYDGTALSTTNKSQFTFRNATAATGTSSVVDSTANLTLTISSGSTLGATSGTAFRIWIVLFNDAGTLRPGAINCSTATDQYSIGDDVIASSTAEGGAGAADSAGVIYTGTAVTSKAMRVLGYMEFSLTTAGTWDEAPDKIQLWQPGMKLPGDVVQVQRTATGAVSTGTTQLPLDDTIPQNTEGDEYMTQAITPTASANLLRVVSQWCGSHSAAAPNLIAALFQDTTADALAAVMVSAAQLGPDVVPLRYQKVSGATATTTFKIRAGANAAGTTTFNGASGGRFFGGVYNSFLEVQEIMG